MPVAKPVRTAAEHKAALAEIDRLWDAKPGTPESDLLEVLVVLVEAYERAHQPIPPPDPVEAIEFRLEQRGETRKDLQRILKVSRGRVSELLNRNRKLTLPMIRALNTTLGIPADTLIAEVGKAGLKRASAGAKKRAPRRSSFRVTAKK